MDEEEEADSANSQGKKMDFDVNDFRRRYPEMVPYIGDNYRVAQQHGCALLVIGESHYLPEYSTIHKDCATWYASDHTKLNEAEKGWISTRDIITEELPRDFPNQAHGIWKYGYQKINQWGPGLDNYHDLFQYTVFYNFYLRPANQGNTFRELLTEKDNAIANEYFKYMLEQHKPNGIVFLSSLAFDSCWRERQGLAIPIAGAPHPTCFWWNRKCGKYGGRFGRDVVQDGMKGMDWSWTKYL